MISLFSKTDDFIKMINLFSKTYDFIRNDEFINKTSDFTKTYTTGLRPPRHRALTSH